MIHGVHLDLIRVVERAIQITTQDFRVLRRAYARVRASPILQRPNIDEFRISPVQRSDGWIATPWNNMSDPGAFAAVGAEEQEVGQPPPLAGAGVVVCLMG